MSITLKSFAEEKAKEAEKLEAFGGFNLLHIKRGVGQILSLIGRDKLFDEYTKHDISHINKMLDMLDWLVPKNTKEMLSSTDWLLIVLGVYFHDVGMLVTRNEFDNRNVSSSFFDFCENVLFSGEDSEDYFEKINSLSTNNKERFLYQEFVRKNHATRIRYWITPGDSPELGITGDIKSVIDRLLKPLGSQFRRDLGIIAESHHLDDLDNTEKYQTSQPYGDSDDETGNLQYAAVLLRTADLLHITTDRTPSEMFRLINPVDPLSQQEWAKQMAVKRVRDKKVLNKEGRIDPEAVRDTIEVHAYFQGEEGFFGLTSYLSYAASQLAKSFYWIATSVDKGLSLYEFPWNKLDDSNIETEGFLRDAFQFTIDQKKILNLLTGHTLYNDSSVVLRELVQNSLDAIRLRLYNQSDSSPGRISIKWDSEKRILSVCDNGTGMTQEIIKNHLLHVGASLYQEQGFKKKHPGFSSISRFGIGVLSTFMIADVVEIITCSANDVEARRLALRSVHGKYLISLLDKKNELVSPIFPHGTFIKLQVRKSVKIQDVLKIARHWIVIPGCEVELQIDGDVPIKIGYSSPGEALVEYLNSKGLNVVDHTDLTENVDSSDKMFRVVEYSNGGIDVAVAVKWVPYFHEWTFVMMQDIHDASDTLPTGTCIGGIRIDNNTPGFTGVSLMSLVNANGANAPQTNVARSGLDINSNLDFLLRSVFSAYCSHIKDELEHLTGKRGHSLTWAIQEAQYILTPFFSLKRILHTGAVQLIKKEIFLECFSEIPIFLVESTDSREPTCLKDIAKNDVFWTISCSFLRSAELLFRETKTNISIRALVKSMGGEQELPLEPLLCTASLYSHLDNIPFEGREVSRIVVKLDERRLDLAWAKRNEKPRWTEVPSYYLGNINRILENIQNRRNRWLTQIDMIPLMLNDNVDVVGCNDFGAIIDQKRIFILGESTLFEQTKQMLAAAVAAGVQEERTPPVVGLIAFYCCLYDGGLGEQDMESTIRTFLSVADSIIMSVDVVELEKMMMSNDFMNDVKKIQWKSFNLNKWERYSFEY